MKLKVLAGKIHQIEPIFNSEYIDVPLPAIPKGIIETFKENPGIRSISIELDNGLSCTYTRAED